MANRIVGFESANSFIKGFTLGKALLVYPNTLSKNPKESITLSDAAKTAVYEVEGTEYTVGKTLSYKSSSMASVFRYSTPNYKIESLIAIAQLVDNNDTVIASTGIPSKHYGELEDITSTIQQQLKGYHEIKINGEIKSFTIAEVIVKLQPYAAFYSTAIQIDMYNQYIDNPILVGRIQDNPTLVVDIGWGSTDIADVFGLDLIDSFATKTSIKHYYESLLQKIKTKYAGQPIATASIELLEIEKQLRKTNILNYGNVQYDCGDIINETKAEITLNIITELYAKRELEEYTTVVFTGGGSELLRTNINQNFYNQKTQSLANNIYIGAQNTLQYDVVRGYYLAAEAEANTLV